MTLLSGGSGTTPCPECGEPMGLVTWVGEKPTCHRCQNANTSEPWQSSKADDGQEQCLHDQLEKSLPLNKKGGAHGLACNCPKCRIVC